MRHLVCGVRLLTVALLLLVGQGMVPVAFLADNGFHAALRDIILLPDISGIEPEVLPLVLILDKRLNDVGVVYAGIGGVVFFDELRLLVGLDVVLVAIVVLTALLRPAGVNVLVAALVGLALLLLVRVTLLCLPKGTAVALLDLLVLLMGVMLTGSFHESGIDNLAFAERQAERVQV